MKCTYEVEPPVGVVRARGLLDLATVATLRGVFLKCLATQPEAILVDAAELVVTDDIHLIALAAAARNAAAWPSIPVMVCAPSSAVASAMRRLGIDRSVRICDSVADGRRLAVERVPPPRTTNVYPPASESVSHAREVVAEACRRWGAGGSGPVAELLVTELVANAVRHARTPSELILCRSARYLHIAVRDYSSRPARLVGPGGEDEPGGRGLLIVDALATHWGCTPTPDGKVTWVTLATGRD